MNPVEVLASCQEALAASAAIAAWCQAHYGTNQTVYLGVNEQDPPADGDYPLLLLGSFGDSSGQASDEQTVRLLLGVGLYDESQPVRAGNTVSYLAGGYLTELRRLALVELAAVVRAAGGIIVTVETEADPLTAWPEYTSLTELVVVRPWEPRENRVV